MAQRRWRRRDAERRARLGSIFLRRAPLALALVCATAGLSESGHAAPLAPARPGDVAVNFATAADAGAVGAAEGDLGCLASDAARRFDGLACAPVATARPRELKIDRGEASWSLNIIGADQQAVSEVRSRMSVEHVLGLGPLGGWRLHVDVSFGRPTLAGGGVPLDEQTHLSLSIGLPWGCTLRIGASAAAQGALDPGAASTQSSELAAVLSRGFHIQDTNAERRVDLTLAARNAVDRLAGTGQRLDSATLRYAQPLGEGSLAAEIAFTRIEALGAAAQRAARSEIKYARSF
jgi:hypothetical protein